MSMKAAAKAVAAMGIATKKDPECVRVVVRCNTIPIADRAQRTKCEAALLSIWLRVHAATVREYWCSVEMTIFGRHTLAGAGRCRARKLRIADSASLK